MDEIIIKPENGYMRLKEILKLVPVGKTTWWNGVKAGRYPQPTKLSQNVTGWRVGDIAKLLESFHEAA